MRRVGNRLLRWWLNRKKKPVHFPPRREPLDVSPWQQLLQRYVGDNGVVDYKGLARDEDQLDHFLDKVSQGPPAKDDPAQLAYWINAYNAFTIKAVLTFRPNHSIREADQLWKLGQTVFDRPFFSIAGKPCSLNTIEHQVLRIMQEPRIHFAINCASGSCPVLRPEAYEAHKLEGQLQEQAKRFLLDPNKNKIGDDQWALSPIFDWFADDFGGPEGVQSFIQGTTGKKGASEVRFLPYDWSLNKKSDD